MNDGESNDNSWSVVFYPTVSNVSTKIKNFKYGIIIMNNISSYLYSYLSLILGHFYCRLKEQKQNIGYL